MSKFKFEIQGYITVVVEADNDVDARMDLLNRLESYGDEMMEDPYVSDGVEI